MYTIYIYILYMYIESMYSRRILARRASEGLARMDSPSLHLIVGIVLYIYIYLAHSPPHRPGPARPALHPFYIWRRRRRGEGAAINSMYTEI